MKWVLVGVVVVLVLPVVFIGAAFADLAPGVSTEGGWTGRSEDLSGIPPEMLHLYEQAAAKFDIPNPVLAGVGKIECDHNRNPDCARPNVAGAVGPMQFLPTTFARYAGAAGSPSPSILDPKDAVFAAAAKLAADGVGSDPWAAIHSYNHSDAYVAKVAAWAVAYGWVPESEILARAVLSHPNLSLRKPARGDVSDGRVDRRVLAVLSIVANSHQLSFVGPFISGHSTYVAGTDRISNHILGRAVDLPVVDGNPVSPRNDKARSLVVELTHLPDGLIPDEIGSPWPITAPGVDTFTADHADHLHFGFGPNS